MDVPCGSVCRVSRTRTYTHPTTFRCFFNDLRPCLELVWAGKMILEDTVDQICSSACEKVNWKAATPSPLPPCFHPATKKKQSKRQKLSDA